MGRWKVSIGTRSSILATFSWRRKFTECQTIMLAFQSAFNINSTRDITRKTLHSHHRLTMRKFSSRKLFFPSNSALDFALKFPCVDFFISASSFEIKFSLAMFFTETSLGTLTFNHLIYLIFAAKLFGLLCEAFQRKLRSSEFHKIFRVWVDLPADWIHWNLSNCIN